MRLLKSDKGYALFITLVVIILFTVLGMTILVLTSDGMKKNNVRKETVQAKALAETGIDGLVAKINSELTRFLGEDGKPRNDFSEELMKTLNKYVCSSPTKMFEKRSTGEFGACIVNPNGEVKDKNDVVSDLRKLVTFESIGKSGSAKRTLTSTIEIGAEAFPETMKYAIGTNIMSKNPKEGEGNLLLHGSSDIHGDIKVDGNLISYDHGTAAYKWEPSLLPRAYPSEHSTSSKLVLGKSMYKVVSIPSSNGSQSGYDNYIKKDNFNTSGFSLRTEPKDLFDEKLAPRIVKRDPTISPIGITDKKDLYYFDNKHGGQYLDITNSTVISGIDRPFSNLLPRRKSESSGKQTSLDDNLDFSMTNTNNFNKMAVKQSLTIVKGDHTFKEGLFVGSAPPKKNSQHNLTIGNKVQTDNPNSRDNIKLDGSIYVNGDVTIQGANLESNALMYVDGDVNIRFSSINGKKLNDGSTGTLIIFATGDIYIANNSVDRDEPSTIKGFFYSQKNFEMYGVGSNIRIEGGISASRIVLNAIRGKSSNGTYQSVAIQKNSPSRLQVIYDANLIENFLKLNKPEPIIRKIDPPLEKDRK